MKSRARLILFIAVAGVVVGGVACFLRQYTGASGRRVIAARINPSELRDLEVKTVEDLVLNGYAYERNEFRAIPSLSSERLNTMVDGKLPAFEYKEFKFVILHKWINFSWGVGYGQGSPTRYPTEFTFEPLRDGIWIWTLDLER